MTYKCCYTECRYGECRYDECLYADCRDAERRGALTVALLQNLFLFVNVANAKIS